MTPPVPLPGGFCEDCFKGTLRGDAKLTGTEETIHGLPVYVARPDPGVQPLGLVVIISDAFGWELLNTRALADAYARRGPFVVYLPDFMNGYAPPASFLGLSDRYAAPSSSLFTRLIRKPLLFIRMWLGILPRVFMMRESLTRPRITAFLQAVRADPGFVPPSGDGRPLRIGVAGFCWGGRYAALACGGAGDPPLADCGFTAHPSLLAVPGEVEHIRMPFSVANGPDDQWLRAPKMRELTALLEGKDPPGFHEVVIYEGARHGFAVRGDPLDPRQAEIGLQAEDQAVKWFQKQFESV